MTEIEEMATKARGMFLNEFCMLEKNIELYIAKSFFSEKDPKIWDLIQLVLDRITFENKRTCLRELLERVDISRGHVKTNTKGYPSNKICNEIRRLNDHRNYFAHYMLYLDDEEYKKHEALIGLYEIRDKANIKWFTKDDFTDLVMDAKKASLSISKY